MMRKRCGLRIVALPQRDFLGRSKYTTWSAAGVQCVLPDPVLLQLSRSQPPLDPLQLRQALQPLEAAFPQACCFPSAVLSDAAAVVGLLKEAAGGQRPWVSPELSALVQPGGGVAAAARRKHQDPAAFRDRLVGGCPEVPCCMRVVA
jgi:hypothetical protein